MVRGVRISTASAEDEEWTDTLGKTLDQVLALGTQMTASNMQKTGEELDSYQVNRLFSPVLN